ncbi:tRNA (adenosine(37)-N6)-threonylcarbamoyltransferase complex dimerization subunit type 1 TsaB [Tepidamorphus sp. 3E244]|uniref:tRNA (adenosine(37)-N6)-threonylcarbamoyltransferase complex dimerization subunit type 1 TsaB n=1 Tax=Tepidamorphus sp. 3E244 TaxID=3385498 RepID=UPI0038FD20B1
MRVLSIDTTGPACCAALVEFSTGETVLGSIVEPMQRGHAEALIPMLDRLVPDRAKALGQVDRIAVTIGPGSFTGLRVGISAARGLALALGKPVVGVTVFDCIRASLPADAGPLAIALDARRNEIYLQAFDVPGLDAGPQVLTVDDAAALLPPDVAIFGTAAPLLGRDPGMDVLPCDPLALARVGARLDPAIAPPTPLYLRKPDAKPQAHAAVARA